MLDLTSTQVRSTVANMAIKADLLEAEISSATAAAGEILSLLSPNLLYHNAGHTFDYVFPATMELAKEEGLSSEGQLLMAIIALFHDTGFVKQYVANEPIGAHNAVLYARKSGIQTLQDNERIIYDGIMNTNMQSAPKNLFEMIIRDADLSALGLPAFIETSNTLRAELLQYPQARMHMAAKDDGAWSQSQLRFITSHAWFTASAKRIYQKQQEDNIAQFSAQFSSVLT